MRAGPFLIALVLAGCSGAEGLHFQLQGGPLSRGPQVAQVQETEAIVAFLTGTPLVTEVEYGPTAAYGASVSDATPRIEHVFTLRELAPGTTYLYRIRIDGAVASEGHSFRTVPSAPDAPFRFVALGDSGDGNQVQRDIAAQFGALDPDLVLHVGDAVYEFGAASELDKAYFLPYRDLIDHIPFYVALGNHDLYADDGNSLLSNLYLPVNYADGTERYYSFDFGDAHFVALDSNQDLGPGSLEHEWLEADLAMVPQATWKFVFFHHPPYSSGHQGENAELRETVVPVLERYGVDLVFNGDDHLYHRSYPISDGTVVDAGQDPDYVDAEGPVYIVTGGGGHRLHALHPQPFTAYTERAFHFVVVDVAGRSLTLRAIRRNGTEMDRMTLTKSP